MFDKLEAAARRYDELMMRLSEPGASNDAKAYTKLMKEQGELAPVVETYGRYRQAKQDLADAQTMLAEEKDEELRDLAKEEAADAKARIADLEQELKILLLPKDPNDEKNVIVEIRAGAGGEEAALFAAELYRMYVMYAESRHWKAELVNVNETGLGGFKEVVFMLSGKQVYSRM
ncbi:MAG: PCRF domain-containing protein, partial [Lachnospiraceae bacterium]|nr:PCRF domain-containing protein [Lachnospiraceae bacterium]